MKDPTKVRKEDLIILANLIEAGKLRPVIDQVYKLAEAPRAFRQLDGGHAQ